MSLSQVRSLFRTRLDGLGYREWPDGFNFENIPDTILDRSYHIETGLISGTSANQTVHNFSYSISLRVFLKGYRDPAAAIDDAVSQAETILADILSPSVRLSTTIKDIVPDTITVEPFDISNDNDVILKMDFTADIKCLF
jgi:hypothetical protein